MKHTVCITGTNRGIGLEFAKQYAAEGWEVLACSRHPAAITLQSLKRKYTNVSVFDVDVCNEQQIKAFVNSLRGKPIDLLINSAGIYGKANEDWNDQKFHTVSAESMREAFNVNTISPLIVSRSLLGNVKKSQLKMIATLSSCAGSIQKNKDGGNYAYRTSKAAVNMIIKGVAADLKPQEIKVLLLHPGWVKTDMGGANADINVETSVKGMRNVISEQIKNHNIDPEKMFLDYQGQTVPW